MTRNLLFSSIMLVCLCTLASAQTSKTTTKSNAEKMGYARSNKYYGPGTFYCYAPGKPNNKMANNSESAMRDLTGISADDFYTEIAKQGFVAVPQKEVKKWFNENNSKDRKFYYAPDKSYILSPGIHELSRSAATESGYGFSVSNSVGRYMLIPLQDSLKVMDAIWQYLRDLNEMKVIMSSFGSTFKKANPKAYPIEQAGASGWTSLRAGTFVLTSDNGKVSGHWERIEDIIRRTIGKPEFNLKILGMETDFAYSMHVMLQKEGYVINYEVVAGTFGDLEPGNNWVKEYPHLVEEYKAGVKGDKDAVNVYKTAPLPPVLEDLNTLLHIEK